MPRLFQQYPDQKFVQGIDTQPDLTQYAKSVGGVLPGIGDAISAYDAYKAFQEGNYVEAGLDALGVLPFIPSLGGITKTNIFDITKQLAQKEAGEGRAIWDAMRFDEYSKQVPDIQNKALEIKEIFDNIENKYRPYLKSGFITEKGFDKLKTKLSDAYVGMLNSQDAATFNKNFESMKVGLDSAEQYKEFYYDLLKDLGDTHVGIPKLQVIENLQYKDPFGDTTK